ncbi:MAG: lipid-A-disaccharide synthase [Candidatus Omnitrophica bacterium]|nr:lipid-A-disaccharide synthase [Candidatus Omnitrophota bacterium]MDD5042535.1 lipid-A-disaccharide synthase [Candidatus Omnitrophota bacterium]
MAQIKKIFIICGEPSGDLLAGNLAGEMLKLDPGIKFTGIGGKNLRDAGAEIIYDIGGLSVMGLLDVLKKLPRFLKLKRLVLERIKAEKPDAIIFVDFSGFNLRLAKALNKSIPAFYYVSPQVWASREKRIKRIKEFIDEMVVLFKFEEEFYRKRGIRAHFAGHPLADLSPRPLQRKQIMESLRLDPSKKVIALLPGSRKQEIKAVLPLMLKAGEIIEKNIPGMQFIIAKSAGVEKEVYEDACSRSSLLPRIAEGKTHECLESADFCLVCSGTATLEAAILQKPFLIVYKMGMLNYFFYRPQIKIPYIGIVNIVCGRKIVPEYIQFNACPEKIARNALALLNNPSLTMQMLEELRRLKEVLGPPGAAERAARIFLGFLNK